mmetsp:Transcript_28316/g.78901  ORF Transcript_28316/g.78901 Transcript_28316/m.78901 type:complete len:99 (-) Transcript_28316:362-658(-)
MTYYRTGCNVNTGGARHMACACVEHTVSQLFALFSVDTCLNTRWWPNATRMWWHQPLVFPSKLHSSAPCSHRSSFVLFHQSCTSCFALGDPHAVGFAS